VELFWGDERMKKVSLIDSILWISGWISNAIIIAIIFFLFYNWMPLFKAVSPMNFFFGMKWYPTVTPPLYGILPLLVATLEISFFSLLLTLPLSFAVTTFMVLVAPKKIEYAVKIFLEFFSGIPSVILGLIGLSVIAPYLQNTFNLDTGLNVLNASLMLTLLTIPMTSSMMEDFVASFPENQIEGAEALGATKLETLWKIILPGLKGPLASIAMLSAGRIFGETMIVLMVAGNAAIFPTSIFDPAKPLSATIAAEMGETAVGTPHFYALFGIGATIFFITLLLNIAGEAIRMNYEKEMIMS
jgi:phosphate transport system permease protein